MSKYDKVEGGDDDEGKGEEEVKLTESLSKVEELKEMDGMDPREEKREEELAMDVISLDDVNKIFKYFDKRKGELIRGVESSMKTMKKAFLDDTEILTKDFKEDVTRIIEADMLDFPSDELRCQRVKKALRLTLMFYLVVGGFLGLGIWVLFTTAVTCVMYLALQMAWYVIVVVNVIQTFSFVSLMMGLGMLGWIFYWRMTKVLRKKIINTFDNSSVGENWLKKRFK